MSGASSKSSKTPPHGAAAGAQSAGSDLTVPVRLVVKVGELLPTIPAGAVKVTRSVKVLPL